jgi:hypothetical protein
LQDLFIFLIIKVTADILFTLVTTTSYDSFYK